MFVTDRKTDGRTDTFAIAIDRTLLCNVVKNAFNMLRRDSILEAGAKHFPELLHFTSSTIVSSSALQFGEFTLMSEEGAQQGDPLGPLYFCLVFKELLDSMCSELVLGYLDDVAMGDTAEIVLRDFIHLETVAAQLGLEINRSKCEVVGHTDESRSLFEAHGVILPESENVNRHSARCSTVIRTTFRQHAGRDENRSAAVIEETGMDAISRQSILVAQRVHCSSSHVPAEDSLLLG